MTETEAWMRNFNAFAIAGAVHYRLESTAAPYPVTLQHSLITIERVPLSVLLK